MVDRHELRRQDYSLSEDHTDLQAAFRQFFTSNCSIETVWAAETTGFDKSLWERLCAMGATTMALPESSGGDGATLVDLTLVAEELGRVIAPVPWIDHVCATQAARETGRAGLPNWSTANDWRPWIRAWTPRPATGSSRRDRSPTRSSCATVTPWSG